MNKAVRFDTALIRDWRSFHEQSKRIFGFPDFYGGNMNAWIDCLSDIDDDTHMSNISIDADDTLVIELINSKAFQQRCPDIYLAFFEAVAFINHRKVAAGGGAMIAVAAYE